MPAMFLYLRERGGAVNRLHTRWCVNPRAPSESSVAALLMTRCVDEGLDHAGRATPRADIGRWPGPSW